MVILALAVFFAAVAALDGHAVLREGLLDVLRLGLAGEVILDHVHALFLLDRLGLGRRGFLVHVALRADGLRLVEVVELPAAVETRVFLAEIRHRPNPLRSPKE